MGTGGEGNTNNAFLKVCIIFLKCFPQAGMYEQLEVKYNGRKCQVFILHLQKLCIFIMDLYKQAETAGG